MTGPVFKTMDRRVSKEVLADYLSLYVNNEKKNLRVNNES